MKLPMPDMSPLLSFSWLVVKLIVFLILSMQATEIVVVAYQQF